ncbi:Blue-light-activated protein [Planctomycetes bacterium Pan216]|uniref:histidine kinase n=1 Tax=Kolteria novifilia TaxID=2527975 RepID=A0A518AXJ9_9BACT|nr:Blue-light-activated protein [Planctomycetes bacterium Pan216]
MHVILVEDNPDELLLLQAICERRGHQVSAFRDGESAWPSLREGTTSLVLLDRSLPGSSGLDLCRRVRDEALAVEPFILMITAHDSADDIQAALDAGANDFLAKPFSSDSLHTRLAIAERRVAENDQNRLTLARKEEQFRQLVEHIRAVFWMVDGTTHQLLYMSPYYEAVWGSAPPKDLSYYPWLLRIHPQDRSTALNDQSFTRTTEFDCEYRILRPDGSLRWVRNRAFPVKDAEGNVVRIAGIANDVTERRFLKESLRQAQRMEAIGQIAGGIAHEFNNLLQVIIGNISFAQEEVSGDIAELLEQSLTASERSAQLVGQLLAFGQSSAPRRKRVYLESLVGEVVDIVGRTFDRRIDVSLEQEGGLPEVFADPEQIHHLVLTLCIRAREALEARRYRDEAAPLRLAISTSSRVLREEECKRNGRRAGEYVRIAVADTGLSGSFAQREASPGTLSLSDSTLVEEDLGIAWADDLMNQHGGWTEVEERSLDGTTIAAYLPAAESESSGAPSPKEFEDAGYATGHETILLIDDEPMVRGIGQRILTRLGYTVLEAEDGLSALEIYRDQGDSIDLVILDLSMPRLSGEETLARLREHDPNVRVIVTTGYSKSDRYDSVAQMGVLAFLTKPFRLEELSRTTREAIDGNISKIHASGS